jgi:AcrR family transcriptional regulator
MPDRKQSAMPTMQSERGNPRAQFADVQRARIVAAAIDAVAELGYGGLTVTEVIARAHISRRTFYELYADRDECFLAAFDAALARVAEPVLAAYQVAGAWRERIANALCAALALFDDRPALARLLIVDALGAGPLALERRAAALEALVRAVDDGRANARGREPGPLAAEAVVGAVLAVLHKRLLEPQRREPLLALAGPLMNAIVLPYLGPAAAARELRRRPSQRNRADRTRRASEQINPLEGLDMRLTYRTLRVLSAVGELADGDGDPSNRDVAAAAGIADQGQTSKLLARLGRLGLVANAQPARARGEPFKGEANRWTLTARGRAVLAAVRDQPVKEGVAPASGSGRPAARRTTKAFAGDRSREGLRAPPGG